MANPEHLEILKQGVEVWNKWREENFGLSIDLSEADLSNADLKGINLIGTDLNDEDFSLFEGFFFFSQEAFIRFAASPCLVDLRGVNLNGADLSQAKLGWSCLENASLIRANLTLTNLMGANLIGANLRGAYLPNANLVQADLRRVDLRAADLNGAILARANLIEANLVGAKFMEANLNEVKLTRANLTGANLSRADLSQANLIDADLRKADLNAAYLSKANLNGANLGMTNLSEAVLIGTELVNADLNGSYIYGISAWDLELSGAAQKNLVITQRFDRSVITVDDLEVAQFIYLLLKNEKVRQVIDSITSKAVLILGRFTEERIEVLNALKNELRQRDYLPILFNFEKPASRDLTETISTLAHMSRFIIADVTDAKSIPQELQAIVPDLPSVPVRLLIQKGADEYALLGHFKRYHWVIDAYEYYDTPQLLASLTDQVIKPAEAKVEELKQG